MTTANELHQNIDHHAWTDEWLRVITENPSISTDRATMSGWFANAIMAGYDKGYLVGSEAKTDNYGKRVIGHYKIQTDVLWSLMSLVERLCPDGEWVFQLLTYVEKRNDTVVRLFQATITNGDDNVTCNDESPTGAVAGLLFHMLKGHGNPFPLTGNGGRKRFPADNGWIRE